MRNTQTICVSFRRALSQNIKELAKDQVYSLEYWFRRKYNFSPHDPLFLSCELWEIELEYEMDKALDESHRKLLNICPECGSIIHGNHCDKCDKNVPTEKYYDPDFEDYFNKVEAEEGRELPAVEDSLKNPDNWKEV